MKTLKPGRRIPSVKKWWIGLKGQCDNCKVKVAVDKDDWAMPCFLSESLVPDKNKVRFLCPTTNCHGYIYVTKPKKS
jgi:hypothetical protein